MPRWRPPQPKSSPYITPGVPGFRAGCGRAVRNRLYPVKSAAR